jgi:hypothetical protein
MRKKVLTVFGSAALLLMVSVPASAHVPPPTCAAAGGNEITVSFNALDGHNIIEIGDRQGGPDPKYTICHFGQNHTGPDFIVAGPLG